MRCNNWKFVCLALCFFSVYSFSALADTRQGYGSTISARLGVDGRIRNYDVYIPKSLVFDGSKQYPVLLVLHGGGPFSSNVQKLGFNKLADRDGAFVVYPKAYKKQTSFYHLGWNDGRETTDSAKLRINDVKYLKKLINQLLRRYPIDKTRVYLTGASNGGMMTYRMGCEASELLAGIAPVIANLPTLLATTCTPKAKTLSFVSINGTADPLVPYNGGQVCKNVVGKCFGGLVQSAEFSVNVFASAAQVDKSTLRLEELEPTYADGTKVVKHVYTSPSDNKIVAYEVQGMGHAWPPFKPQSAISGTTSRNLSATSIIWNHFGLNVH